MPESTVVPKAALIRDAGPVTVSLADVLACSLGLGGAEEEAVEDEVEDAPVNRLVRAAQAIRLPVAQDARDDEQGRLVDVPAQVAR